MIVRSTLHTCLLFIAICLPGCIVYPVSYSIAKAEAMCDKGGMEDGQSVHDRTVLERNRCEGIYLGTFVAVHRCIISPMGESESADSPVFLIGSENGQELKHTTWGMYVFPFFGRNVYFLGHFRFDLYRLDSKIISDSYIYYGFGTYYSEVRARHLVSIQNRESLPNYLFDLLDEQGYFRWQSPEQKGEREYSEDERNARGKALQTIEEAVKRIVNGERVDGIQGRAAEVDD